MGVSARRLLVTTALEESWGDEEEIVFLGEWCKLYGRRETWSARTHQTIPFHWDDRDKLARDFGYLKELHRRILDSLARSLNQYHAVDHDARYWQTILDPWLLSYVSVLFDRWESLRAALDGGDRFECVFIPPGGTEGPPSSYVEFLEHAFSDEWNQRLYQDVLRSTYAGAFDERAGSVARAPAAEPAAAPAQKGRLGLATRVDRALSLLPGRSATVFVGQVFQPGPFVRLNAALRQLPRLHTRELSAGGWNWRVPQTNEALPDRHPIDLELEPAPGFETYLLRRIGNDLPRCAVEYYPAMREAADRNPLRPKVMVTAGSHWVDPLAKTCFAERVERGARLVVTEHGGSLPPIQEFTFEEDIADVKATWFRPYHPKHVQMPPPRLIGRFPAREQGSRGDGPFCSVIANECARWVHRAHFYPMAGQWVTSFDMVLELHAKLRPDARQWFRVKPYPNDDHWNTRERFIDELGADKVLAERSTDRVLGQSRLAVCTYPETTFSEAMASGVPTVLMYPDRWYELHPVAADLLVLLKAEKIVFTDAESAASHIDEVWEDPLGWWNGPSVRRARDEFNRQALRIEDPWLPQWTRFLKGLASRAPRPS